jgi:regulator of replication initiation timing
MEVRQKMKDKYKRLLAFFMTFILTISITPLSVFKPVLVKAVDSEQSAYMKYQTNITTAYNVWGYVNGVLKQTTFNNNGFRTKLIANGSTTNLVNMQNGVGKTVQGIVVTQNLSIVNGGRFVKVQYVLYNTSASAQTISLGSGADIQIGDDDYAPITKFTDGSGFYMTEYGNGAQFNFIGKGAYGVTDVDTFWYGHFRDVDLNMFNQVNISSLTNTDSGMAYAWNNRTIQPNSTQSFSVLIGIGTANKAPVISITNPTVAFPGGIPGGTYNFSGSVSDAENTTGTEVYYAIDNRPAVKAYTFNGAPGGLSSSIAIPSDISSGSHTITFYAQDKDGGVSAAVTRTINIALPDTTPPTFTVSGNPTTWTNGSVTLAVAASDAGSGLNTAGAYSFDNGATWTTSSTKSFSTNQTVNIKVKDNNGNISSQNIVIDKIDTIAPTITVEGNPTTWTKGSVTLAVTASDSGSGLNAAGAYSFDGGTTWTTSNTKNFQTNQTVSIKVKDALGNIVSQSILIDKIDNLAPSFTSITQTPTGWTANSVALTVNGVTDNAAGLNATTYSFSTAEGVYNWQASNTSGAFSENQNVYVYVRDAVGNISTASKMTITNIDNTPPKTPVITNAVNFTSDRWYNSNQTVTASFETTTGAAEKLQYKLNDGAWIDGTTVTVAQEGINNLKFRVIDEIGRTSGEATGSVQIDKTLPTVTANDENYNFRNSNFNIIANYSDGIGSGIKTREYIVTNSAEEPTSWTSALATQQIAIEAEGQWYIHYKVTDEAGNSKTGYFGSYKLDKTLPTGTLNVEPYKTKDGIDYTRNQLVSISLTGNDNLSNVAQMRFANSAEALTSASWEGFSATKSNFALSNGNGLKTVYYEVKDNAGNISEVYSDSIYFDNIKPAVTISAPSQYVVKSGDVITYTATFTDNSKEFANASIAGNEGIDGINFTADKILLTAFGTINANDIIKSVEEVPGQPLKRLIKLTMPSNMTGVGSINLTVAAGAAEDKAGNLSNAAISGSSFSIDNEAPTNQNSILTKDLYVKGGSVIKLDNTSVGAGGLESDSVRIAPAGYNGDYANTTTVTSTHGLSVYINAPLNEGEYYVYVVDSAENISAPSTHKITVDNSGPLVTVSEPSKTVVKGDSTLEYTITFADDATLQSISDLFKKTKIALETTGTANATISIEDVAGSDRVKKIKLSNFTGNGSIDKLVIGADICRDIVTNGSIEMAQATKITIDTTVPEIPTVKFTKSNDEVLSKILNFVTFNTFWKEKIKVSINSSDVGGSNLSKIYYKTAEGDTYTALTPDNSGNVSFELPVGFKGNIWAYSEDEIGNVSAPVKSDGTISENSAPQISVNPSDFSNWSVDNLDIQVTVTDNEGLKEIHYTVDGTETVIDMVTGFTDKQVSKNFKIALNSDSPAHSIQIQAVDLAGNNAATYNATVKQDKTVPTISSVAGNPSNWTKDGVTLTVNASDAVSGLASEAYSFDGGITWQASSSKTYVDNTNGIVVKVKDTAGNIATFQAVNITKIDKTAPNTAVIANKDKYVDNNWYNENQTITASFTTTAGCSEKLQYKLDNGTWTDGQSAPVNVEGKHTVSFRVIDDLGRTSEEQTVKVNIDKTAPTNAKITMKDKTFTSFLNKITFGLFFDETVKIDITADSNISGVKKIEYQKVSDASKYSPEGTWTEGNSFSVVPDDKFVVYARITDNAGNYVIINSDGVIVDATKPVLELTEYPNGWSVADITLKVASSDSLAGLKDVTYTTDEATPQAGTVTMTDGKGTITLVNEGQYKLTVKAKDNSNNELIKTIDIKLDKTAPTISSVTGNPKDWTNDNVTLTVNASDTLSGLASEAYSFDGGATWQASNSKTYTENANAIVIKVKDAAGNIATYDAMNITKIDKTTPVITGATEGESYFIGRVINLSDDLGEVGVSTYKNGTGVETPFKSGDLFDKLGTYTLSLKDKGGNVSTLSFEIKALPEVKDVLYTPGSKKLIEDIRAEFNKHNDLPEPYKTNTDKKIKELEERYTQLDKEVSKMKADTETVLKGEQGLVTQREQIKALLDSISKLTAEQQASLKEQIERLKAALQAANDKLKDLDADADSLSIVYAQGDSVDSVTKALYLTKSGKNGSVITWNSSDADRITNAGRVNRPEPEAKDLFITLTASLRDPKTNEVITKQFKLTLKKLTNQEAANEAARQLTVETALSFDSSGDNWESVTNRFLLLSKGAYNSTISWESNKSSTIAISNKGNEVTGSVTRPEEVDESVIITATINKNGATATKTFLIIVKQKKVTKQPISVRVPTETNATIVSDSNGTPVYVNVKRTTLDDNAGIIDTLIVTEQAITALTDNIDPLAQADARIVAINMQQPTDGTSKADEQAIEIPAAAVQAMAERNAILEVKMDTVMIKLDAAELKQISDKGTDLYFKVVPIKDSTEQSKLSASTKANEAVIEIVKSFGDGIAVPQGVPYTVETNYSGVNTRLLVPFTGITIPTENRDAFLDSLRVYIEHTDGTKEAKSGTIVYENGAPIGIEITIDRFSSFQIFSVEKPKVEVTIPKTGSPLDFNLVVIGGILLSFTGVLISRRKNKKSK